MDVLLRECRHYTGTVAVQIRICLFLQPPRIPCKPVQSIIVIQFD